MKAKVVFFFTAAVVLLSSLIVIAQEKDNYAYSMKDLKHRLDLYSARRVEIGAMLDDENSIMLIYKLPGQESGDVVLDMVHMLSRGELQKRIGAAVIDYCLESGVDPESEKAINFGNALYQKLQLTDKINRREYQELFKEARLKEEQIRQRILDRQQEMARKEASTKEKIVPGMVDQGFDISGIWKTDRYGDTIEFKRKT